MSTEHQDPRHRRAPAAAGAAPIDAARAYQVTAMSFKLVNAYVVADLRTHANRVTLGGWTWWDTRPWLDAREHAAESIDMARLAIDYAVTSGLAMRHPHQPWLLHILAVADQGMTR